MIAAIIAITAVLVLSGLLFPVTIYLNSARSGGKIDGIFVISWMIILYRYALKERKTEILVFGRRVASRKRKPEEKKKPIKIKKSMLSIGDIFDLGRPMLKFSGELVTAFKLKYLDIDIKYGLDDPAYTGILAGFLYAACGSLRIGNNIKIEPDFSGQMLDWNMKANVSIRPIQIIPPIARFVTDRQVLRAGWKSIRG